jgi:acyl-ACP thioesterase
LYKIKAHVYASQTGSNGKMKLTGALETIQDCSLLWLESEPSFWNYLTAKNLGMFIVSRQVDIVRLPVYGERITVQTRIFDCNGFLGYRNTALYGEDGLPCLLTWGLGLFVNMDTGKMARIPKNEIEKITIDQKLEMEYLDKKIRVPDIPGRRSEAVVVKRGDIDLYRHMNNVKYIEVALEFLPEDFEINRLRIEYKKSAKMGDVLYPQIIEESSAHWYILLPDAQGNPFAVMEIS